MPLIPNTEARLLLACMSLSFALGARAAEWSDNFDLYPLGSIHNQGGWQGWDGNPSLAGLVSDAVWRSAPQSQKIANAADSLLRFDGDYTSGNWVITAYVYVPAAFSAGPASSSHFTIFSNTLPIFHFSDVYNVDLRFDSQTANVAATIGSNTPVTFAYSADAWSEIRVEVYLDYDWARLYFDGLLIDDPTVPDHPLLGGGYAWSRGATGDYGGTVPTLNIAAINLSTDSEAPPIYYDDLSLDDMPIYGACCNATQACIGDLLEPECETQGGYFYPFESCNDFACPDGCPHQIELLDCFGGGWIGNSVDVLVNGNVVLSQLQKPLGQAPFLVDFQAATGDAIVVNYNPTGVSAESPYYRIHDGMGYVIGQDGISGSDCTIQPTVISVTANCDPPTVGACCDYSGGCQMVASSAECSNGDFLGLGHECFECPCYVTCPKGASAEPESCGTDVNAGCDAFLPAFSPISCDETVCGTLWSDEFNTDFDWYRIVTTDWSYITWSAESQIPIGIDIVGPGPGNSCQGISYLASAYSSECVMASATTAAAPPGEYWLRIAPTSPNQPCDQDYTATVSCAPAEPTYCTASGGCFEYIERVQCGAIDNLSGCTSYGDYTSLATELPVGGATILLVTPTFAVQSDFCRVWIDWNQDLAFSQDEIVETQSGLGPYAFDVTPPLTALHGPTRMRIRLTNGNPQSSPCDAEFSGEVEDYSVNVVEVPGACCVASEGCSTALPSECAGTYGGAFATCSEEDCNGNGVDDFCDIATGNSADCDENGTPDDCQAFEDCNGNSVADFCDQYNCDGSAWCSDCNNNGTLDECDVIACGPGDPLCSDCNANGTPDGCELASPIIHTYQYDDGEFDLPIGPQASGNIAWLNHFVVGSDAGLHRSIELAYGFVDNGTPVTVYLWSDPNQDGDPSDAQVLASVATTVSNAGTSILNEVAIPPTLIGSPGTHFFAGAILYTQFGDNPAQFDFNPALDQAWICEDSSSSIDPNNLSGAETPVARVSSATPFVGSWMIRVESAHGGDCNENNVPDDCDIPPVCQGVGCASDCNGDAIPDACQLGGNDCNGNDWLDSCDIADQISMDCNHDGAPDECEVAGGSAADCQADGVPDECQLGSASSLVTEGFESGVFPPQEWLEVNSNGNANWEADSADAYSGLFAAKIVVDPTGDLQDEWLLTPLFDVSGPVMVTGASAGSVFWALAPMDTCDLEVWVVVGPYVGDGDDVFLTRLEDTWSTDWLWSPFVVNFNAPAAPFRIGFRYFAPAGGVHAEVYVDDIEVSGIPAAESNDCNKNGLPDDCDWCGDIDGDADVDGDDYDMFVLAFGAGVSDSDFNWCSDADADGVITQVDYQAWLLCYRSFVGDPQAAPPSTEMGDYDRDGDVDLLDFARFQECAGARSSNVPCRARFDFDNDAVVTPLDAGGLCEILGGPGQ